MLNRRDAIKLGAVAGAAVALPAGQLAFAVSDDPPVPPPFSVPLEIPPVLSPERSTSDTDFYRVTIRETTKEILPGIQTRVLTYNGTLPGPTIKARKGRNAVVTHTNAISTPVAVHLHGANVAASSDGHPLDVIQPGGSRTYTYPNAQPAATLWYHDHAHHLESEQVYRGLAGAYLISDSIDQGLPLPRGEFDVPLIIRDARFDTNGQLVFVHDDFLNRNTVLVNGRPQPFFNVKPNRYRLRLVNGSNVEGWKLSLSNGAPMTQIASDGGFLRAPVSRQEVELWPAERAEVIVDFSRYAPGTKIQMVNAFNTDLKHHIIEFRVGQGGTPDHSSVPSVLNPEVAAAAAVAAPTVTRRFTMHTDPVTFEFLINGQKFDPHRVDATIKRGTTEIWEIVNGDGELGIPHAMHLHLVQFRVLDRNGSPEPAYDAYPKDTVRLYPGDVVRIQATFNTFTGRYPFHCHFIDHSTMFMMGQFEVVR
jgi:FtsP/CotA-like multicopper oxidase with cupredoxin domain